MSLSVAELPATSTALVVVDMQEYFCQPDSNFGRFVAAFDPEGAAWYANRVAEVVIPTIADLAQEARAAGVAVTFTEFGSHRRDGADMPVWARRHNEMSRELSGGPCYPPLVDSSCRVVAALAPQRRDRVVQKVTSGPSVGTDLIEELRREGITTAVVTGVATNVCVMGMARELADADFDVSVVGDGCATVGEPVHEAALFSLGTTFASVVSAADLRFSPG